MPIAITPGYCISLQGCLFFEQKKPTRHHCQGLDIAVLLEVSEETEPGRETRFWLQINERARCDSHTRVVIPHSTLFFFFPPFPCQRHMWMLVTHTHTSLIVWSVTFLGLAVWGLAGCVCRLLGQQYGLSISCISHNITGFCLFKIQICLCLFMRIQFNYHCILITQLLQYFVLCKHNSVIFYMHIQNILWTWHMTRKDTVNLCLSKKASKWLDWRYKPKLNNSSGCMQKQVFTCFLTY